MTRERVVVVCSLIRSNPEPLTDCSREFCADCKSRVWLSASSRATCLEHDVRALPVCPPCARLRLGAEEEAEFLQASEEQILSTARALGVSQEGAAELAERFRADWRAGRFT